METESLILITEEHQLNELIKYIEENDYISYDTETNGVESGSQIVGFSISAHDNIAYYVVLSYWDKDLKELIDLPIRSDVLKIIQMLGGKKLIMHNGVFDCQMTSLNFGVELMPSLHTDTMILAHLVDENRPVGLKELGVELFGEDAKKEQLEMKQSVLDNGGELTKKNYELYKADHKLLGRYGAKDAILTIKIFYSQIERLIEQNLYDFFYTESMPLLRTATYDLNTAGLKVDVEGLSKLRSQLEVECMELKAFIHKEINSHVSEKYPGTTKSNVFNINGNQQLAWLLFDILQQDFHTLTESGRELCQSLGIRIPYSLGDKIAFIQTCRQRLGEVYASGVYNHKTGKTSKPKTVQEFYKYTTVGVSTLSKYAKKYRWVEKLLEYKKAQKMLKTYVIGIQERTSYGIIRPRFLQHGTTSGRNSSRNPNFQNLPRGDKRIKKIIISRPGKVFVGADFSQLEPRVFASISGDKQLQAAFSSGDDFYSVIGMRIFDKYDCTPKKDGSPDAFGVKYPKLRDIAKVVALSATYGTTAAKMAGEIKKPIDEAQQVINDYFESFPDVHKMMLSTHEEVKKYGQVLSLFGRPRRIPTAKSISKIYGTTSHKDLPFDVRTLLNLAVNHKMQSAGASIMNRAAIAFCQFVSEKSKTDKVWLEVRIVMQIHDEFVVESPETIKQEVANALQHFMENTTILPGVVLEAIPKIAYNLADLK